MPRTLLAVEPDPTGWSVTVGGTPIDHHASWAAALDAASQFARLRHDATGEPTGVRVPMGNGDVVLMQVGG